MYSPQDVAACSALLNDVCRPDGRRIQDLVLSGRVRFRTLNKSAPHSGLELHGEVKDAPMITGPNLDV
jgi:hypothetical protein